MPKIFFCLSLVILLASSCQEIVPKRYFDEQKMQVGDSLQWAEKHYDDSNWPEEDTLWTGPEPYWLRIGCDLTEEEGAKKNLGIRIAGIGSYYAYFDGTLIGQNGVPALDGQEEDPGTYISYFPLPDSLTTQGDHVLALRMTQNTFPSQHIYFHIDDYLKIIRGPLQLSQYMFLFAGAFLLATIYFLFVFMSRPREYSPLIISFVCFIVCTLLVFEYLKFFYFYPYPFQYDRLVIIGWCHVLMAFFVPYFFMLQFAFPYKKVGLIILLSVIFVIYYSYPYFFDYRAILHNKTMWYASAAVIAYAVSEKKNQARIAFGAVAFGFSFTYLMPFKGSFLISSFDSRQFIAFTLVILVMLYILTRKRQEERRAYEAQLVLSERLKNELLKKNIKPHFIMNTLTSLMDWVEESPKEGVKFISALADEFKTLNQIADHKLVPIEQEIRLCKNHLKVMSYRKEITYKWEEKGIDFNEIIPPAVIHTAVENGVTHSLPDADGTITFRLIFEKEASRKTYRLLTLARNREASGFSTGTGTGLRYIKARLEESYPGQWAFTSEQTEQGWETKIIIKGSRK